MTRSNEDIDASTRVTMDDVYAWQQLPGGNAAKDVNRSGSATNQDRDLILASVRAAERMSLQSQR